MFSAVTGKSTIVSGQLYDDPSKGVPGFWFGALSGDKLLVGEGKVSASCKYYC
jgi:hypothetical protein